MSDEPIKSETNCIVCGKEWLQGETFIELNADLQGAMLKRGDYVVKDADFGSIKLASFCEDCAAKTREWNAEIRYDEIREDTEESYLARSMRRARASMNKTKPVIMAERCHGTSVHQMRQENR